MMEERGSVRLPKKLDDAIDYFLLKLPNHYKNKSDFIRTAILSEMIRVKSICRFENLSIDLNKLSEEILDEE